MDALSTWEHGDLVLSVFSCGALVWRLWSEGLARQYRFLVTFLVASIFQALAFLPLRLLSTAYGNAYFISSPILWILSYFVVLELFQLILEDYPGISSAGRRAITWSMCIALIVSAILLVPDIRSARDKFPFLQLFYLVERS